jgi:hypothetical protein
MATLSEIKTAIQKVVADSYYDDQLDSLINDALQYVAGGVIMPDGDISPPLPDLHAIEQLTTSTTDAYVALPTDYQRDVFYVVDSDDSLIFPVTGGDYYSFNLFMHSLPNKALNGVGSVYRVCVKGSNLYYQDIPETATQLTIHYYRKPILLDDDDAIPEGLPEHLSKTILKHWVCREIFGEGIEDGEDNQGRGYAYHDRKFYEAMQGLVRFIGNDGIPYYYDNRVDRCY